MSDLWTGSNFGENRDKVWNVAVELARALVRLEDSGQEVPCDAISAYVSDWGDVDGGSGKTPMRYVHITIALPAKAVDAALVRAGVILQEESELEKAQKLRYSLMEME